MFSAFIKSIFCGCNSGKDSQKCKYPLSRSQLMLMIPYYNLDYTVIDNKSGEVVNCELVDTDSRYHSIEIVDDDFCYSDYFY